MKPKVGSYGMIKKIKKPQRSSFSSLLFNIVLEVLARERLGKKKKYEASKLERKK